MRRISFFLPEGLQRGLDELKERDGVPAAESIRRAIESYLNEKGVKPIPEKKGKKKR